MAAEDAILGTDDGRRRRKGMQLLKRMERWLVVLGVVLHAVYMMSIFDIYFKTPIVHGMDPVVPGLPGRVKCLVLLVADGLRADKFFEPDSEGSFRAPFLRSIIKEKGRWGVSHAHPPTESRPGHVAIIAGFTRTLARSQKVGKLTPLNSTRFSIEASIHLLMVAQISFLYFVVHYLTVHGILILMNTRTLQQSLLNRSQNDEQLRELLHQDNIAIFLHLLGCDSNGHAHRPYSSTYLNNVKVVDDIARRVYDLVEGYFKDNCTAYVFAADHGMSDKGSHGDGHPSNTDTPLVVWGAGVKYLKPVSIDSHPYHVHRVVDEHMHDMPTPKHWGLSSIERVDVNQADIAPLMEDEVEAVLANTEQILSQFLQKSRIKQENTLYFTPFKPLTDYTSLLDQIEKVHSLEHFDAALKLCENLRSLALEGLHYFKHMIESC